MSYDARLWALVEGDADACAYGELDWKRMPADFRARVSVSAKHFQVGELELEARISPGCPREPKVVLLALNACVRHVDVNGWHREDGVLTRQSHLQGEPPADFLQWLGPNDLPLPPEHGIVSGEVYRRIFESAAHLMNVDTGAVVWSDPPMGGSHD